MILEIPNHLTRMSLFDFRKSIFILIEDSSVKFGMCQILMKEENAMIRGFIFKIFPGFGFKKIFQKQV